jgi:hypothetical protein
MEDNSIIHDPLSYEEQQMQLILMNEVKDKLLREERQVKDKLLREERQVKECQDIEYQESLLKDMEKVALAKEASAKEISIEEISIEEMRQIRLKRFS